MHPTSNVVKEIDITGYATPFYKDEHPVIVELEGHLFISVFSTKEKCDAAIERMGLLTTKVKQVDDSREFLDSIREANASGANLRVMVDPYIVDGAKTRFTEIRL